MNKKLILYLGLFIILVGILGTGWYLYSSNNLSVISPKTKKQTLEMAVYSKGSKTTINPASSYFQPIQVEAEDLLVTADDGFRLIVYPETIKKIKEQESCLELIYNQPKTFTASLNNLQMQVQRILIPLSGKFVGSESENNGVIFYGDKKQYSSGPYRNSSGISELKNLLNSAGVVGF